MTPRGTTYVTIGSHGFYYRETLSSRDDIRRVHPIAPIAAKPQAGSIKDTIASAGSFGLVDSSCERLVQHLNERANRSNPAWILYIAALMSLAGLAMLPDVPRLPNLPEVTLPLLAALGLFIAGVIAPKKNAEKRKFRLFYELDEAEQQKHNVVQQSLGQLSKCHRVWRIETQSETSDWKRNAGASSLVQRAVISVGNLSPQRLETNVPVPSVNMGRSQLYFLPDTILYRDTHGYGAIAYSDFRVAQGLTRFIESDGVPADATVIDHTWRYVNKNGGPDRRFNNNRELPVLQLGVLVFTSSKGLNIQINTSNPQQSLAFADCWRTLFQRAQENQQQRAQSQPPPQRDERSSNQTTTARTILGVSENASGDEISVAYRRLAQMYHPDKVAGLAPEFQALADKRMTEINVAYEVLKHSNSEEL